MWIESVSAHAFGPLAGESLQFGPGLTVVYGPNESAKSTWHAALYAALCGRTSSQRTEDRQFVARHRPWDRPDWVVEARLRLDDGRRIRLRQDLLNNADRQAIDLDLGRDCSAEIVNGQFLDAALWLGLDRQAFRATACIGQAQLLDVLTGATDLKRFLQAAVASGAGRPVDAIKRLEEFHRAAVGGPKARRSPIRLARSGYDEAQAQVHLAREQRAEYERRLGELDLARREQRRARALAGRDAWAAAAVAAGQLSERRAEAHQLADRIEAIGETDLPVEDSELAAEVAAALLLWRGVQTHDAGARGVAAREAGARRERLPGTVVRGEEPAPGELWRLVSDLEVRVPEPDPARAESVRAAEQRWLSARRRRKWIRWLAAVGAVGGLVGAVMLAAAASGRAGWSGAGWAGAGGAVAMAAVVAVAAAALATGGAAAVAVVTRRRGGGTGIAWARLEQARRERDRELGAIDAARQIRQQALRRCADLGLATQPEALRALLVDRGTGDRADPLAPEWRRAEQAVLAAAARAGVTPGHGTADHAVPALAADAVPALEAWQRRRGEAAVRGRDVRELRQRLAGVLGGATVGELDRLAEAAQDRADRFRAEIDAADLPGLEGDLGDHLAGWPSDPAAAEQRLTASAQLAHQAALKVHQAEAQVRQAAVALPIGEAEEQFARAGARLRRVEQLDATLQRTLGFLRQAQEWAHRTLAPTLNEAVGAALPAVTQGRYTEAAVDPQTLEMTVWGQGGAARAATRLSHGTTEQIYLLLRVALAEYLVRDGVSCPLLLDDVTVHADQARTGAILRLLHGVAERHQVIVFSQQEQVREWAAQQDRVTLHELASLAEV